MPGSGIRDCAQQSSDESKQAELHYQGEISSRLELLDAARKYLKAELNHLYAEMPNGHSGLKLLIYSRHWEMRLASLG